MKRENRVIENDYCYKSSSQPETRQIGFSIPNKFCRWNDGGLGCKHDDNYHTCCKEECMLMDILFNEQENWELHMELSKKEEEDA